MTAIEQTEEVEVGSRWYWHGKHYTVRERRPDGRVLFVPDDRKPCKLDWVEPRIVVRRGVRSGQ